LNRKAWPSEAMWKDRLLAKSRRRLPAITPKFLTQALRADEVPKPKLDSEQRGRRD
jgi:hypothetical protein